MLGTTKPCGVAIAIPMLWDPIEHIKENIDFFKVLSSNKRKEINHRSGHTFESDLLQFFTKATI